MQGTSRVLSPTARGRDIGDSHIMLHIRVIRRPTTTTRLLCRFRLYDPRNVGGCCRGVPANGLECLGLHRHARQIMESDGGEYARDANPKSRRVETVCLFAWPF